MNREDRNIGSVILFIIILIVIAVGGYFLIKTLPKAKDDNNSIANNEVKSIKIDDDKDYVYFINEEFLNKKNELKYKDIKINFNTEDASNLEKTLNEQMASIKKNVTKTSDVEGLDLTNIDDNDDIYEAEMIDYDVVETDKYVSISVNDYIFKLETEATNSKLSYYVFDISNGKLLNTRDILNKEGKTDQEVRVKIREYISGDDNVDIDATLNHNYSISIGKNGKLIVNTLVKTSESDYNVSIEL